MQANYSNQPLHYPTAGQPAIFLAGPTPRFDEASQQLISASWRPEAVRIFARLGYEGIVYAPENHDASPQRELDLLKQARWEWEALDAAPVVLFWVPRGIARWLATRGGRACALHRAYWATARHNTRRDDHAGNCLCQGAANAGQLAVHLHLTLPVSYTSFGGVGRV